MSPSCAVVGDAVAAGIRSDEGLSLTTIQFALGWVDGVGMGWSCASIGVLVYLLTSDVLPSEHVCIAIAFEVKASSGQSDVIR